IVPLFDTMLIQQGEGSETPTEPHHTPSQEAQPSSHTHISLPSIPSVTSVPTIPIPTIIPSETTPIRQYIQRARIAQSSTLLPVADEPAFPEVEINRLKERVKILEDKGRVIGDRSRDDAPIKGRRIDEEEVATERVSDDTEEVRLDEGDVAAERASEDTEEMATVLTTIDAATVLASGTVEVPTGSGSILTAGPSADEVPTGSYVVPTASPLFATATVISKHLAEYDQAAADLTIRERIELINELVKLESKGMSFEEVEAKFKTVWEQIEGGVFKILKEKLHGSKGKE
nr:hypothetical protein [Tanacetum cinerariifolium]